MKSLVRGILLLGCSAAGIALALWVVQAPPHDSGRLRQDSAGPRNRLPSMAALLRPAPTVEAQPYDAPPPVRVPLAPRLDQPAMAQASGVPATAPAQTLPLIVAVPTPSFAQQIPGLSPELIDMARELVEKNNQATQLQQEQIDKLREAIGAGNLPPSTAAGGPAVDAGELPAPNPSAADPEAETNAAPPHWDITPAAPGEDGKDRFDFNLPNMEIHQVLELLAAQGNLNILPTKSVSGTVSLVLNDVDLNTAMEAICRTNGLIVRRKDNFVYVGTPEDFDTLNQSLDKVSTRVFRPNYVSAGDLQTLLTPLLTPTTGKISVTTAAQVGIASDGDEAGGNSMAMGDAVVVQDYEANLAEMEQIVAEIDVRPMQVAIEAMILSVKLSDKNAFGINWNFLLNNQHVRMATGTIPDTVTGTPTAGANGSFSGNGFDNGTGTGNIFLPNGGLAFAFLDQNLGSFITALETIGDTDVIASPRLMCLNKQRAEILIGAKLGYVSTTVTETSTAQTVEFLEVGAQLRIRPFISTDGSIRMEVHPELSTGTVRIEEGFTLPDKEVTQVTTNIMVRDGCTVVIGGLMREDLTVNTTQVPLLGSLPAVGVLFRQREETIERREILVLVTPHIAYDPQLGAEGDKGASEFHRRQRAYLDSGNPLGRDYLGRKYLRMAQEAIAKSDVERAMRLVDLAVRFDSNNRAAIDLQNDLAAGQLEGDHRASARLLYDPDLMEQAEAPATDQAEPQPPAAVGPEAIDGAQIDPWVLKQLEGPPMQAPLHPRDLGEPGSVRPIAPGKQEFE